MLLSATADWQDEPQSIGLISVRAVMEWEEIYSRIKADPDDLDAYLELRGRVKRWARRDLWNQGDPAVDDATNDTCAITILRIEEARGPRTFRGFVIGHYLNIRKRHMGQVASVPIDEVDPVAADPPAQDDPKLAALERCFEKLRSKEKQAINMRFFEGCSYHEIAEKFAVRAGNARRIVFNGVQLLRECMAVTVAIASNINLEAIP